MKNMFQGAYIGIKDVSGQDLHCGDRVKIFEDVVTYDYNNPILNFEDGTFRLPEHHSLKMRLGIIRYDIDYLGFVFIPDGNQETTYVRMPLDDYCIKYIIKGEFDK